jgi:hypothetical protein
MKNYVLKKKLIAQFNTDLYWLYKWI